jgi:hypothetical protein
MEEKTENALITYAKIEIEDHDILTAWLHLKLSSGGNIGFGGRVLEKEYMAKFLRKVMETLNVHEWDKLKGNIIRVKLTGQCSGTQIIAIGHPLENKWFYIDDLGKED